jgi:hypothetical protein
MGKKNGAAGVRGDARRKSWYRAGRVFIASPLGVGLSVPDVFHAGGMDSVLEFVTPIDRVVELISAMKGALVGDPLVILGTVLKKLADDLPDKVTNFGTFGYLLTIDVKRAVRIGRDGHTRYAADRIKKDEIRSTRHVYRHTSVGQEVILLCNSSGTAIAVESEIRDAALISALRAVPPDEGGTDAVPGR